MIFPKIYKPSLVYIFISIFFISLILFLLFTQIFPLSTFKLYALNDSKFWMSLLFITLPLVVLNKLFASIIGYKVTFKADEIVVTTIYGSKSMHYSDISFYYYTFGTGSGGRGTLEAASLVLYLVSRDKSQNVLDISLLKGPKQREIKILINFDLDNDFKDWIASIPSELGLSPLSKVMKW